MSVISRGLWRACALLLIGLLATLGVLAPMPAQACGCGAFVGDDEGPVSVEQERAAIGWDGQNQRIVLSLSALSQDSEAALLLPTPGPAQVSLADEDLFDAVEEIIEPEVRVEYYWWPRDADGDAGSTPPGSVQVLETIDLGPLEATVLDASDPDDLASWLDEHGYVMGDSLASAVSPYVTEGWYYVAVRMNAEEPLEGALPPLDVRFESSAMVYPMRMSAAATTGQRVRTYVFADQRVARADATAQSTSVNLLYAGAPPAAAVDNPTLAEFLAAGPYLTVMDQAFGDPGAQIVSDFVFERSSNGGDYHQVVVQERLRVIAGMPAGPLVLTASVGAAVLAALVLAVVVRRRGSLRDR